MATFKEETAAHFVGHIQKVFPKASPVNATSERVVEELERAVPTLAPALKEFHGMLTVPGVAERVGLSRQTVRTYMAEGRMPGRKLGNRWVVSKEELEAWITEGEKAFEPPVWPDTQDVRAKQPKRDTSEPPSYMDGAGPSF